MEDAVEDDDDTVLANLNQDPSLGGGGTTDSPTPEIKWRDGKPVFENSKAKAKKSNHDGLLLCEKCFYILGFAPRRKSLARRRIMIWCMCSSNLFWQQRCKRRTQFNTSSKAPNSVTNITKSILLRRSLYVHLVSEFQKIANVIEV